ncbi:hypothetical protein KP509_28G064700 [Ceratopteris richardii]|uniref:RIN4 pathogenic type III effector avirulence factor Avr cleavage site domain-containing protein n=1 Tax=Ceratopteris richardii TaxID=49495 RepID=A0A8T2RFG3_CERRI|nr:hypothetical protein KP509_28G064700 [Ceratopteris richardii]
MATGKGGGPLPKFGDWNEQDPASGEGFTAIFNQARDDRKPGGPTRIPAEAPNPPGMDHGDKIGKNEQSKLSIFACCFRPSTAA